MSVWVCCVRYTVHFRDGTTVKGPNSRLTPADSTRTVTGVGPVKDATSISTGCLPLGREGTVWLTDCGHFGEARVKVALVRPGESMEATRMLCSPWAALGTSGECARVKD